MSGTGLSALHFAPMEDVIITGFDYVHEFRHNGEALARVRSDGAVDVHLEVPFAEARFWLGHAAWRQFHRRRIGRRPSRASTHNAS